MSAKSLRWRWEWHLESSNEGSGRLRGLQCVKPVGHGRGKVLSILCTTCPQDLVFRIQPLKLTYFGRASHSSIPGVCTQSVGEHPRWIKVSLQAGPELERRQWQNWYLNQISLAPQPESLCTPASQSSCRKPRCTEQIKTARRRVSGNTQQKAVLLMAQSE